MTYDYMLEVFDLTGGTPLKGTLTSRGRHFFANITVGHRRFWEAVQADTRIDRSVRIPEGDGVTASQYVRIDGVFWRIEEAQHTVDEDGLPVTNLSLRRWEGTLNVVNT